MTDEVLFFSVLDALDEGPVSFPDLIRRGVIPDRTDMFRVRQKLLWHRLIRKAGTQKRKGERGGRPAQLWRLDRVQYRRWLRARRKVK